MQTFQGFGKETISFLRGLSTNNEKTWFDAHRHEYDTHYIGAAKAFILALAEPLLELVPEIRVEPKVNGSIFRINRDIRFSKDKTPYKDHLDLWFWQGDRKNAISGLFFRLTDSKLILGAGAHVLQPDALAAYRAALQDPSMSRKLLAIEQNLAKQGVDLKGEHYKTVPRGLSFDDERLSRLSRHNALHAAFYVDHPDILGEAAFVDFCVEKWRGLAPLHQWLVALPRKA